MNKALKFTIGALLAAGATAPVLADHPLCRTKLNVGLTITEPSNGGTEYANIVTTVGGETYNNPRFVTTDHEADFTIGIEHLLPDSSGSRLFFDYDHFSSSENQSDSANVTIRAIGVAPLAGGLPVDAAADLRQKDQSFTFGMIKTIVTDEKFAVDLKGALQYAKVERDFSIEQVDPNGATGNHLYSQHNEFSGWGPTIGAQGRWFPFANPEFSVIGSADIAWLWGDHEYHSRHNNVIAAQLLDTVADDTNNIVTKLHAQAALEYRKKIQNGLILGIMAGVRFTNYINAFTNGNTFGDTSVLLPGEDHEFSRWGPFIQFTVGGANSAYPAV